VAMVSLEDRLARAPCQPEPADIPGPWEDPTYWGRDCCLPGTWPLR